MTKEEAREILKNSDDLQPWKDEDDIMNYSYLGDFNQEYEDGFGFAVYPYTAEEPLDPTYAIEFFVEKETGEVSSASGLMVDWELARLTPPKV